MQEAAIQRAAFCFLFYTSHESGFLKNSYVCFNQLKPDV